MMATDALEIILHIQLFGKTRMLPMSLYVPNRLWGRPVASLGWSEHALLPSIKKTLQLNQQIHSNSLLRGSWSKPVISTKLLLLTLPPEGLSFYLFSLSPLKLSREWWPHSESGKRQKKVRKAMIQKFSVLSSDISYWPPVCRVHYAEVHEGILQYFLVCVFHLKCESFESK